MKHFEWIMHMNEEAGKKTKGKMITVRPSDEEFNAIVQRCLSLGDRLSVNQYLIWKALDMTDVEIADRVNALPPKRGRRAVEVEVVEKETGGGDE